MSDRPFKVGDRVRRVDSHRDGEVVYIDSEHLVVVRYADGPRVQHEKFLELVAPSPTPAEGRLHYVEGYGFAIGPRPINLDGDGPLSEDKRLLLDWCNNPRRVLLHETECVTTKEEIARLTAERDAAVKRAEAPERGPGLDLREEQQRIDDGEPIPAAVRVFGTSKHNPWVPNMAAFQAAIAKQNEVNWELRERIAALEKNPAIAIMADPDDVRIGTSASAAGVPPGPTTSTTGGLEWQKTVAPERRQRLGDLPLSDWPRLYPEVAALVEALRNMVTGYGSDSEARAALAPFEVKP